MEIILYLVLALSTPTPAPTPTQSPIVKVEICPEAIYQDSKGIAYICKDCICIPHYPELHEGDQGKCGLWPFETGTWDPHYHACRRHDAIMQAQADGNLLEPILKTQIKFVRDVGKDMVAAIYSLTTGPIFILLGVGIGLPLALYRKWKGK